MARVLRVLEGSATMRFIKELWHGCLVCYRSAIMRFIRSYGTGVSCATGKYYNEIHKGAIARVSRVLQGNAIMRFIRSYGMGVSCPTRKCYNEIHKGAMARVSRVLQGSAIMTFIKELGQGCLVCYREML